MKKASTDRDQAEQEILNYDVSDDMLEAAGGPVLGGPHPLVLTLTLAVSHDGRVLRVLDINRTRDKRGWLERLLAYFNTR
jgi:hypothetical protein